MFIFVFVSEEIFFPISTKRWLDCIKNPHTVHWAKHSPVKCILILSTLKPGFCLVCKAGNVFTHFLLLCSVPPASSCSVGSEDLRPACVACFVYNTIIPSLTCPRLTPYTLEHNRSANLWGTNVSTQLHTHTSWQIVRVKDLHTVLSIK